MLRLAGDELLVEQIRRGNEAAFEVAFQPHAPAILGFCRHMLDSPDEAEDAVQHTFAAANRDLERDCERSDHQAGPCASAFSAESHHTEADRHAGPSQSQSGQPHARAGRAEAGQATKRSPRPKLRYRACAPDNTEPALVHRHV